MQENSTVIDFRKTTVRTNDICSVVAAASKAAALIQLVRRYATYGSRSRGQKDTAPRAVDGRMEGIDEMWMGWCAS